MVGVTSRAPARPALLFACTLLLGGCTQGMISMSPSTVLSTVILAGEVLGSRTPSSDSRTTTTSRSRGARFPESPAPSATASRVLGTADQYVGVPYTWGGSSPKSGFDCSGFTKYVFARHGIQLPRTSREQARAGRGVALDLAALLPGDIMLFAERGEAVSHVAIYVGSGQMIHASSGYGDVNYLDLNTSRGDWYVQNMVAARRLTANGRSLVQSLAYLTIRGLPFDPPDRAPAPR